MNFTAVAGLYYLVEGKLTAGGVGFIVSLFR